MAKCIIICVCYENPDEVITYVKQVAKQTVFHELSLIVTNNSDHLQDYEMLKEQLKEYENVWVYDAKMNLGYIHGLNFGLQAYLEAKILPQWIVLSNTDIDYQDQTFYEKLFTYYPDGVQGILAPSIYSTKSALYQNPLLIHRYSKARMKFFTMVFHHDLIESIFNRINKWKDHLTPRKAHQLKSQMIYAPHGALMILNRWFFEQGGNFKYGSFMFGEELYLAEITHLLGGQVYYDNRLKVLHNEHSVIKKEKQSILNQFYYDSMTYLLKKFY